MKPGAFPLPSVGLSVKQKTGLGSHFPAPGPQDLLSRIPSGQGLYCPTQKGNGSFGGGPLLI